MRSHRFNRRLWVRSLGERTVPTTMLVTLHDSKPVAKVIDFGIARATGQQLTEKTVTTNFTQIRAE